MMVFNIKQQDTSPSLLATLNDPKGKAVNLENASVVFNMQGPGGDLVVNRAPVVVVEAEKGLVRFDWGGQDTAVAGISYAEFEVTFSNGQVETYPNNDHIPIRIVKQLG